ncbi:undecaprenyl diphosphate synthase [Desulfohalotomaculum tongense]|uniref:isoprenyl transferase n=1 Tax=Desulforadius tongensis TaxID=1216062 RepID=UPI00195627DC|nr:undecaprenyl diphosphate synthase [Desulforadius tongensis]
MIKKLFSFWQKEDGVKDADRLMQAIDRERLPKHIAIIMDGNGRWAQRRGMPRPYGHKAGVESLRDIVKVCNQLKIPVLTVYAFSTENWKRPREEVNALMDLLVQYVYQEIDDLDQNKVQVRAIGRIHKLPEKCRRAVAFARERTADNDGLIFNLALNYGGRSELVDATRAIAKKVLAQQISVENIDEQLISSHLYTAGLPDPDLLIRPSGDFRISNFLIWQLAYTEFWLTDVMWPDFRREDLLRAICDYQNRERRFGGLKRGNNKR